MSVTVFVEDITPGKAAICRYADGNLCNVEFVISMRKISRGNAEIITLTVLDVQPDGSFLLKEYDWDYEQPFWDGEDVILNHGRARR